MRMSIKLLGAVAVAGLVAAGGSAFTGTGVTNNAGATQFVGGQVSQSVAGATLSSVAYTFAGDGSNTAVHSVSLTFADANADLKVPTIVFTGGNDVTFTCAAIAAATHQSVCTADTVDRTGVTSLAITVPSV